MSTLFSFSLITHYLSKTKPTRKIGNPVIIPVITRFVKCRFVRTGHCYATGGHCMKQFIYQKTGYINGVYHNHTSLLKIYITEQAGYFLFLYKVLSYYPSKDSETHAQPH